MQKLLYWVTVYLGLGYALPTSAHTRYVVENATNLQPIEPSYIFSVLQNTSDMSIVFITLTALLLTYIIAVHIPFIRNKLNYIHERLSSYQSLVPWILRISLGILFLGAATSHHLVSPILSVQLFATTQLIVGFLLLIGLFTTPAMIAVVGLFLFGLTQDTYLLGNTEVIGAAVAFLFLGNGRPGIDDLIGIPQLHVQGWERYAPLILRLALGCAFIYLGVYEKFLHPELSLAVVDQYHLTDLIRVSPEMWVFSAGAIETFLGLCILFGFQTRLATAIATIVLAITFFGLREDVAAHVTLFGTISALFVLGGGYLSLDHLLSRLRPVKNPPPEPETPRG